jgi:hypothetical protein
MSGPLTAGLGRSRCNGSFGSFKERAMSRQAIIRGEVCFRAGDGMMMPIPPGPVEIDVADDSVTLGWTANGSPNSTAITVDEYERYLREGKIRIERE